MGDSNRPLAQLPDNISQDSGAPMMEISVQTLIQGPVASGGSDAQDTADTSSQQQGRVLRPRTGKSQTNSESKPSNNPPEKLDPIDRCRQGIGKCGSCIDKIWFCKTCTCQSCSNMRMVMPYLPPECQEKIEYHCIYCKCENCKYGFVSCAECTCLWCTRARESSGTDDKSGEYNGPLTPRSDHRKRKATSELLPRIKHHDLEEITDTPPHNAKAGSSVPIGGKLKTADKTVRTNQGVTLPPGTKNVCIITQNHSIEEDLEFCHIIPQAFKGSEIIIRRLEIAWGVPKATLNIDTSDNLISLTPDMHTAFDKPRYAFMPAEPEIVQRLFDFTFGKGSKYIVDIRDIYTSEQKKSFLYTLVPFENLTTIIKRWTDVPGPSGLLELKSYSQPYSDFPLVRSHVFPHYIIYNLVHKMTKDAEVKTFVRTWVESHRRSLFLSLRNCQKMFVKWETTPTGLFTLQSPTPIRQQVSKGSGGKS